MRNLLVFVCVLGLAISASAAPRRGKKGKRRAQPATTEQAAPAPATEESAAPAPVEQPAAEEAAPASVDASSEAAVPAADTGTTAGSEPSGEAAAAESPGQFVAVEGRVRDGFFMQLTAGLGYYKAGASAFGTDISYSGLTVPAMSVAFGGRLFGDLALAGGILLDRAGSVTYKVGDIEPPAVDVSQYVFAMSLIADYYLPKMSFLPGDGDGMHVQGILGWGGLETSVSGNVGGSDPTGLLFGVGVGYEMWLSAEWSVGVLARLAYGAFSYNDVGYGTMAPALVASLTYY